MNYCDDGGACHHNCADRSGQCYRRKCCEPLSNVFPNDEWPPSTGVEVHEFDPTKPKETPTPPSITVGTQVRLTGVVTEINGDDVIIALAKDGHNTLIGTYSHFLEVIRQPFKRGEVVVEVCSNEEFVVIEDETADNLIVGNRRLGMFDTEPSRIERRP